MIKKLIGAGMLVLLFGGFFVYAGVVSGWDVAASAYAIAVGVTVFMVIAVWLIV